MTIGMKKRFVTLLATTLVVAHTPPAMAGGINLYWNHCGAAGSTNKSFACDTNTGSHDMYLSYDPPYPLTSVNQNIQILDLQSASPILPAWWQFKNSGSCRLTSLTASTATPAPGLGDCVDPFMEVGTSGITHYLVTAKEPSLAPNQARIIGSVSIPAAAGVAVEPGTEYFSMMIRINSARTVGTGACAGCADPVCIVLNEITIKQPPGTPGGSPTVNNPLTSHYVAWQGGAVGDAGCPGATPAVNRTWGQVKSIYR